MVNTGYGCLPYIVGVFFIVCGVVVSGEEGQCHFFNIVNFMVGVKCIIIVVHVIIC